MVTNPPRLMILGIDGGSYDLTSKFIAQSDLPVLSRLGAEGCFCPLETPFPPHTAPGWSSIFTGVGPGEHGIYQFWSLQAPNYRPDIMTSGDFGWEPLWLGLNRHGLSVGAYNIPMSHPPVPIEKGYIITWPLTPTIGYAHPRAIIHDLASKGLHYKSDLQTMYREDVDYLEEALGYIDKRTDTILYLMDSYPTDVFVAVYTELDRVSHCYWSDADAAGSEIERIYRAVDQGIGRILDAVPDDTMCLIVSDHGFGHCRGNLQVNDLLAEAGLLHTKETARKPEAPKTERFFEDTAAALDANWFVSPTGTTVDWTKTKAYMPAPGSFGINLNLQGRQIDGIVSVGAEAKSVRKDLESLIAGITGKDGTPIFSLVPRALVYSGHRLTEAPDFLLLPNQWDVMAHPGLKGTVWAPPTQRGIHRTNGIFFARGPGIDISIGAARTEDVTPTCLAYLGLPVPEDITGRVLGMPPTSIQREASRRIPLGSRTVQPARETALMEKRLAELGYL